MYVVFRSVVCIYISQLLYPFISWWTFKSLLYFGNYKQCYKQWTHKYFQISVFFFNEYIPNSGIARLKGSSVFRFCEKAPCGFPRWLHQFTLPPFYKASLYSTSSQIFVFCVLFNKSHFDKYEMTSHCGFHLHSLMIFNAVQLLIYIQKSVAFVYINIKLSEIEIEEIIPFTIASKKEYNTQEYTYLGGKGPVLRKLIRYWWKKLEMTQTDGKIYHVLGFEEHDIWITQHESMLLKWSCYPRQSTDSMKSLTNFQWHFFHRTSTYE